ncbi:hypothetical protein C8T65DRAFT_666395 [Cerioporus squamosus]|nr:hypothetical protein C8T65DRAFT_666395 [Cerioporus squamosus]
MLPALLLAIAGALPLVSAHIAMFHTSMYGFNWTDADSKQVGYDNRPVAPLQGFTFEQWWFHNHTKYPPNPGDFFELPAGQAATTELACDKSVTSFFASKKEDNGTDLQSGNDPCPSSDGSFPNGSMHTTGFNDLKGCALAIAYESDVTKIKPEDFTVFSVNQTCVWTRFTDFQVPARMPPCPEDGCHCAWFWIHADDSGGEQNYMNGFKCKVTNSTSNVALAKPKLPRRCGADPDYGKPDAAPGNCTYGAKQPFYWFQKEQNNMFEGQYAPPFYTDLYNFKDGAQDDIFVDSVNSTFVPTPFLGPAPGASSSASSEPSAASSSSIQSTSTVDASSSSAQASAVTTSSATSSISPVSSSYTVSTLSQTAAASVSSSISIPEPSLPLSTGSSSIPSFSQPSSASVAVSTSVVVSTVVVTVTAQPAPTSVGTASAAISSSSSILSSSSIPVSDSIGVSAGAVSSTPSSSAFMATQSAPSAPVSTDTQSVVAASTIVLGPIPSSAASGGSELAANTGGSTVVRYGGVLAADSTTAGTVCKREFGKHKVLRRRVVIPSQGPQLDRSSSSQEHMEGQVEDSSLLSRIPLNNRSRLWSFF